METNHDGEEPRGIDGLAPRHAHGTVRAAMVASLHADDVLLPACGARHFDGCLDGF